MITRPALRRPNRQMAQLISRQKNAVRAACPLGNV